MKTTSSPVSFEYVLQPEAQQMLGHFSSLLNVRIGFFSPDGEEICIGLNSPFCDYCQLLRSDSDINEQCIALDRKMFAQVKKQKKAVCYNCHNDLTEAILPVILGERMVGCIMVGQFRTLKNNVLKISKDWNPSPKISARKLKQLYDRTSAFTEQQVDDMLQMLHLMVDYITGHYLVSMKDLDLIQPLINRIRSNPEQTLSVKAAAAVIGRSPSSLFQLFKTLTGKGFSQFQTECKLNEAERLLRTFPQIPIKEVAKRIGLNDPLYFSRLYRKHKGVPPSASRAVLSGDETVGR